MSLTPYRPDSNFDLFGQLEANFDARQIGIAEFAESHEFCGRVLYPRQRLLLKLFFLEDLTDQEDAILDGWIHGGRNGSEIQISPQIRERIANLRSRGFKHFREIVLVGGRRCSKGFVTGLALAKKVHDLLQLQDPGAHYGIDADKEIVFGCVAASQDQAKQMQYADFSAMVNGCSPMQRHIFKLQELEFSLMTDSDIRKVESWKRQNRRVQRDISKIRGRALPANSRSIRGMAAMALVFDEFAHFQQGESDQSDSEVYAAAIPALAQFGLDGLIFCNSSPYSKVGKLYERYEAGMSIDNGNAEFPEVLTLRFPSWALYEGWWEESSYIGPKKCITVSPDWDEALKNEDGSQFYTEIDRHAIVLARQEEKNDPDKYKVERRGMFAETIDAYLIPEMVDRLFAGRPIAYDAGLENWTFEPIRSNWQDATYMHKYYAHLDPSSTTAGFGFALGHTEDLELDGRLEKHVVFDIIKRWNPKDFHDHTIDWEPILDWVTNICFLFRPVQLTMDQFNSAYPITWLRRKFREKRIETRVFEKTATAQTNWDRAEVFRTALYRGLIHAPNDNDDCAYCAEELKFLQEIKSGRIPRVEKQDTGPIQTKDLADPLSPSHEVLTVEGWKPIAEVTTEDLVATCDADGRMLYQHPLRTTVRDVDEDLYVFDGQQVSFAVTGRHNMLVAAPGSDALVTVEARHLMGKVRMAKFGYFDRKGPELFDVAASSRERLPRLVRTTAYGRCRCGCGGFPEAATRTRTDRGEFRGRPKPYLPRHQRRWAPEEDHYLCQAYASASMTLLTDTLHRTPQAIYSRARHLNLARGQIGDRCADRPAPLLPCRTVDFAAFVGFWLGDGRKITSNTGYGVRITQTKPEGVAWLDALMERLSWPHTRSVRANGEIEWIVKSRDLQDYLERLQGPGHELRLPDDAWRNWGSDALAALMDGLVMSDGTMMNDKWLYFYSSSHQLADDVQRLGLHLGRRGCAIALARAEGAQVYIRGRETIANHDLWRVYLGSVQRFTTVAASQIGREPYTGPVYCLTMPLGTFLTRRKGLPFWIGNCVMTITEVTIGDLMAAQVRRDLSSERVRSGSVGGYSIGGNDRDPVRGSTGTPFADFYGRRAGEQNLPTGLRSPGRENPARRAAGGRPIPRRLPGW